MGLRRSGPGTFENVSGVGLLCCCQNGHPTDLAMLQGARLVSASETEEGGAWAEARIKQMTGGDAIRARLMRQDFACNNPKLGSGYLEVQKSSETAEISHS